MAMLRCSGGTARLTAPNTTGKVVPLKPSPISTPALSANPKVEADWAINSKPATYSRVPTRIAQPAP